MATDPSQVPVVWVGLDDAPASMANIFLSQIVGLGEIVLDVGQVIPPPVLGSPEQQAQQLGQMPFVQARALGRFVMTPVRARELYTLLGQALAKHDERGSS